MKKLIIGLMMSSVPAMAQDRVAQYDFDQDGKVSFEDINRYCSVSVALFDRADKNEDGVLSNSEMRTARAYLFTRCTELDKEEV
jgi:Ca2+-binding EF-hand superfamily protein